MARLLVLQDPQWGGVQTVVGHLTQGLTDAGWVVTALPWAQTPWRELTQAAQGHDVLLASHNYGATYNGVALQALSGKPLVSWVHGPVLDVLRQSGSGWLKRAWLRGVYRQVRRFVCVSRTTADSLTQFMGWARQDPRVRVIPNALAPLPEGQPLHVHVAGAQAETLRLGWVGRFAPEKRPLFALEVLREMPVPAQLGLVGEGPMHREISRHGLELLQRGELHFLGKHPHGRSLYTPWQATLLTSAYEGCPMSALESLACGVPCVGLPIPALRELYERDVPYMLARGESPIALVEAVLATLSLPDEQRQADIARLLNRHGLGDFVFRWQEALQP